MRTEYDEAILETLREIRDELRAIGEKLDKPAIQVTSGTVQLSADDLHAMSRTR